MIPKKTNFVESCLIALVAPLSIPISRYSIDMSSPSIKIDSGCKMPIIFMSAHEDSVAVEQALRAGAIAYLQKPFEGKLLIEQINQALSILPTGQDPAAKKQQGAPAPTLRKD